MPIRHIAFRCDAFDPVYVAIAHVDVAFALVCVQCILLWVVGAS